MDDDYEVVRRRQAEERRRKREEERKRRREELGLSRFRESATAKDEDTSKDENPDSSPVLLMKKRMRRTDSGRVERLKEEKRTEDGLRLMQEMYGASYLNADALLDDSPSKHVPKQITDQCNISKSKRYPIDCENTSLSTPPTRKEEDTLMSNKYLKDKVSSCCNSSKYHEKQKIIQNDESSSDEDIVTLARMLQEKKKSTCGPTSTVMNHQEVSSQNMGQNSFKTYANDDSDEDLLDSIQKIRSEKDATDSSARSDDHLKELSQSTKSKQKSNNSFKEVDQDSGSEEDLLAYSRRLQKIQREKRLRSEPKQSPSSQGGGDDSDDILSVTSLKSDKSINTGFESSRTIDFPESQKSRHLNQNVARKNDDLLWDDSDDSVLLKPSSKENGKVGRVTRKTRQKNEEDGKGPDYEDILSNQDFENQLKPEFDNAKWICDLKPFPLNGPNSDTDRDDNGECKNVRTNIEVPASISRYLKDYQKEGVRFLYSSVQRGLGVILGDDMGLGKTVQLISLIAALQHKTGTGLDLKEILQRYHTIEKQVEQRKLRRDAALLEGGVIDEECYTDNRRPYSPILIIVPPSVISNWENEFKTWGHFAVTSYRDNNRFRALERLQCGMEDIMLCGKSMLSKKEFLPPLLNVAWKLIVVDEYHEYKNPQSVSHKALVHLRNSIMCPIIGMTGTLMSNTHKELFNLIDLVQPGLLGTWKEFMQEYSRPIMLARTKDAKPDVLRLGERRSEELRQILCQVYLRRDKSICLEDDLPTKNQKIIFCPLSEVQKALYQHIINDMPEYDMLRKSATPCDCGVNKNFFINYKRLPTKAQKLEYYRRHKKHIVQRKDCCYKIPEGENVVLWPAQHPSGKPCPNCPTCILLPALTKLYKLCSHASLLQADFHPNFAEGDKAREKAEKDLAFARVAIPKNILPSLPGQSLVRQSCSILDDHIKLSGKMKVLDFCLKKFERRRDRVLLFSYSTITLDLIQQFITERGYSHLRLHGSTPTSKRQDLIDKFQRNDDIFIFLISTKAGGMGLNLTAANRVIIYDVNWNPSHDEQAQDRSYRIGQERDVDVVRLVASGTIEELMYMRQVYKVHLKKQTLKSDDYSDVQPARIFRGVDKDKNRKGELFGLENLLKFMDGSFMESMWKANCFTPKTTDGMHTEAALAETFEGVSEEQIENGFDDDEVTSIFPDVHESAEVDEENLELKGFDHEDFLRGDKGDAKLKEGDEGYDEEMGAASQLVQWACDALDDSSSVASRQDMNEFSENLEAALIATVRKSVGLESLDSLTKSTSKEKFSTQRALNEKHRRDAKILPTLPINSQYKASRTIGKGDNEQNHKALYDLVDSNTLQVIGEITPEPNELCSKICKIKPDLDLPSENVRHTVKPGNKRNCASAPLQGARQSIPSFSSRSMLYIPSYLKNKK